MYTANELEAPNVPALKPITIEEAAADVIEAAGFARMAQEVRDGAQTAAKTLDYILGGCMVRATDRPALQRARTLCGVRTLDHEELRRKIESR
jgi:hypothetical protein